MEPANTGYRSIEFTLKNETRQNLFMSEGVFKHGRWDSSEPTLVKADETCVFKVCSKDGALIGVEGFDRFVYEARLNGVDFSS